MENKDMELMEKVCNIQHEVNDQSDAIEFLNDMMKKSFRAARKDFDNMDKNVKALYLILGAYVAFKGYKWVKKHVHIDMPAFKPCVCYGCKELDDEFDDIDESDPVEETTNE